MIRTLTLKGSCQCGAVKFSVRSANYYPYQRCYCSICRKHQGGGGYAINLSGDFRTLKVKGKEHIRKYHPRVKNKGQRAYISTGERHFCGTCGTGLWVYDREWPDLVHPYASVIDSPLPKPPQTTHMMLGSKANWVEPQFKRGDLKFRQYSEESIADWHKRHSFG